MLIKWQDINSVNIKELDEHHQAMVAMINDLSDKKSSLDLEKIIKQLKDYAFFHFRAEEEYFKKYGYPDAENHIRLHQVFRDKIGEFEKQCEKGQLTASDFLEFLSQWWINHINHSDIAYSDFLNSHGVN